MKTLTPYEEFQQKIYGDILDERTEEEERENEERQLTTEEQNYFFNLENDQL